MARRKCEIPIVRINNRRIVLENHTGTITGSTMFLLEQLLEQYGYVRINQHDLVHMASAKKYEDGLLIFGPEERLKVKVPRRNIMLLPTRLDKKRRL